MAEYIDKWSVINRLIALENEFQQYKPFHGFEHAMYRKICETEIAIGVMPAADVEPMRHGRWIVSEDEYGICATEFTCSNCQESYCTSELTDEEFLKSTHYCPNCGARMDGDTK